MHVFRILLSIKRLLFNRKIEQTEKKLQRTEEALKKLEVQALDREENKDIALGTSKLNYLDPRISVAW
jgi:DNA topoisomerase I